MKQQILERARSTVEGFLHRQSAPLTVLSVDPEVNGDGDDLLLIRLTYDDGNDAEGLPGSPALLKLMVRLSTELKDADIEVSPVVSFTAKSEVGNEPEQRGAGAPLADSRRPAEADTGRPRRADLRRAVGNYDIFHCPAPPCRVKSQRW